MLGVAVPASVSSVFPYLAGWLLAGLVAQPVLLLLWAPLQTGNVVGEGEAAHESITNPVSIAGSLTWIGKCHRYRSGYGTCRLLTRLLKLDHAFWVVLGVLPVLSAKGTSATRTFWQQQVGTLIGCLVGSSLVAIIGAHQGWYWLTLPFIIFASTYAASAVGFHGRTSRIHCICGGAVLHSLAATGARRNPPGRRYCRRWRAQLGYGLTATPWGGETSGLPAESGRRSASVLESSDTLDAKRGEKKRASMPHGGLPQRP